MSLSKEEAAKLLEEAENGQFIYFLSDDLVTLDGEYSITQLEKIVKIMKEYPRPTELTL